MRPGKFRPMAKPVKPSKVKVYWVYSAGKRNPIKPYPTMMLDGFLFNEKLCKVLDVAVGRWTKATTSRTVLLIYEWLMREITGQYKRLLKQHPHASKGFHSTALFFTANAVRTGNVFGETIISGKAASFEPSRSHAGLLDYTGFEHYFPTTSKAGRYAEHLMNTSEEHPVHVANILGTPVSYVNRSFKSAVVALKKGMNLPLGAGRYEEPRLPPDVVRRLLRSRGAVQPK